MRQAFRVTGMTCQGCARAVTSAVLARAPSVTVAVDLRSGLVVVDGAADQAVIAAAVEDAGFGFAGPI
jgi:copper chaperone